MTELLTLDLVKKNLVTNQIVLTVGYDIENLTDPFIKIYIKVKLQQIDMDEKFLNMHMVQ